MARIRTIKPEFPQSETIGKLSRDARLLFIMLWTIVDDSGRARASSRMLASLLYPYDEDAPKLIDGWLTELDRLGCIRRYEVDGSKFLDLPNWLKHQRIDKPSPSKFPEFVEASRGFAKVLDGPSTLDLDLGEDQEEDHGSVSSPSETRGPTDEIQSAFLAYNEAATRAGWPVAKALNKTREGHLRKRIDEAGGLDGWCAAIERARRSGFLCGANDTGWRPNIDFFLQPSSFTKLIEGSYDDRKSTKRRESNGFAAMALNMRDEDEARHEPGSDTFADWSASDGLRDRQGVANGGLRDPGRSEPANRTHAGPLIEGTATDRGKDRGA